MSEETIKQMIEKAISAETVLGWQKIMLALLDWPFLSFFFLILFVLIFRKKVVGILERGDIQFVWGDRHIKLRELSDGIDGELDPIREEIAQLKETLARLNVTSETEQATELADDQIQQAIDEMMRGLRSPRYRWRTVAQLASMAGVAEPQARQILKSRPDIVLGTGKSGRQIARLRDR